MTKFRRGMFYLDCANHPCICTSIDFEGEATDGSGYLYWGLEGFSLLDGSGPRCCSVNHCAPEKLSLKQAIAVKEAIERTHKRNEYGFFPPIWDMPKDVIEFDKLERVTI